MSYSYCLMLGTLGNAEKHGTNSKSFESNEPRHEKPVFGVFDQVSLKPACSATEASWRLEILDTETRDIILSRQRTTKLLIRLHGCVS